MSDKQKNKLIPKLRFPEFKDSREWEIVPLGDVIIKNTEKNKNSKYTLVQSVSNKFGFINQDKYFDGRNVASKNISRYYVIKKGYFAYNPSRIDVGSLAYKFDDNISVISPLYVSFKANNKIEDIFFKNYFLTEIFKSQMIFEGGVRNTLNYENLIQIKIPISTLKEQQKIADFLSNLDKLIEAHKQKLELLKQHKKGLMQNLFPQEGEKVPKLRFSEFKDSGEWVEKRLGDYIEERNEISNKNYSLYSLTINGGIIPKSDRYERSFLVKNEKEAYKKVYPDDFAYNPMNLRFGAISQYRGKEVIAVSKYYNIFNCKESMDSNFCDFYFKSNPMIILYNNIATGSLTEKRRVHFSEFLKIRTLFPPITEQQKIASCLSSIDEIITAEAEKIEQLEKHKKGLMQGLFPEINE